MKTSRVDGVGRPKFDFITVADVRLLEVRLDLRVYMCICNFIMTSHGHLHDIGAMSSLCLHLLDGVEAHGELSLLDFHAALERCRQNPDRPLWTTLRYKRLRRRGRCPIAIG